MKRFARIWKDERGASAAEYALVLAIVGTTIAVAALALGNTIAAALGTTTTAIESCGGLC